MADGQEDSDDRPRPAMTNLPLRDLGFVGRAGELRALRAREPSGLFVIEGIAGVGKSSLALEYAHRVVPDRRLVWWIDAEVPGAVDRQFAVLARALGIPGATAKVDEAMRRCLDRLSSTEGWSLILDNVESPEALNHKLPLLDRGEVVVTSRHPHWRRASRKGVSLEAFSRAESLELLRGQVPSISAKQADTIAEYLGDLPLGVAQAAAFMAESRMPVDEYSAELQRMPGVVLDELEGGVSATSLPQSLRLGTAHLRDADPLAVQIMNVCSFLAADAIDPELLYGLIERNFYSGVDLVSRFTIRRSMDRLAHYGFARSSPDGDLRVHRLVAAVAVDSLSPGERMRHLMAAESAVAGTTGGRDPQQPGDWPTFSLAARHLDVLLERHGRIDPEGAGLADEFARAVTDVLRVLYLTGQSESALSIGDRALVVWERAFGPDEEPTLQVRNILGAVHTHQERYEEAERTFRPIWKLRRQRRGLDDEATLMVANNLGHALVGMGEFQEALVVLEETWQSWGRLRGSDDPQTLRTAGNLGEAFLGLHRHQEAFDLLDATQDALRTVRGAAHPEFLVNASRRAEALAALGRRAEAAEILDAVLRGQTGLLGPGHRDVRHTQRRLDALR